MAVGENSAPEEIGEGDGLSTEERAQFAEMQTATSGDAPAGEAADAGAAADGAVAGAEAAAAAGADADGAGKDGAAKVAGAVEGDAGAEVDGAGDDDDDEPALGADGKPIPDPVGADGKPKRKARVSANKYRAEKERADKLATDLSARDQMLARADERMRLISEALATPKVDPNAAKAEEDKKPNKEEDVYGYLDWSDRKIEKLEKTIADIQNGKRSEDGDKAVADAYSADARTYASKEPNFVPAYQHLMASRTAELAIYYYGIDLTDQNAPQLTPQQVARITNTVLAEERGIAENALKEGRSPAQAVFQLARSRGYRPQAPAAAGAAANGANGAAKPAANGGKAPGALDAGGAAAQNGGKRPNVAEEISRIKAGSEAALSLSDGGASPANPLTAQRLADMPEAEFNALMDRLDPEEFRQLVEGRA